MAITLHSTIPAELTDPPEPTAEQAAPTPPAAPPRDEDVLAYVLDWRNKLRRARKDKVDIWNECWQLYRGLEDFSDKEDWQTRMVLPKAWSSVKQATSTIKRLLTTASLPWTVEAVNPDDLVTVVRAEQMGDLARVFLEEAHYIDEFAEGLECAFIIGLGVYKIGWGFVPRTRVRTQQGLQTSQGVQQVPQELLQMGVTPDTPVVRQLVKEETLEGKLMLRAVDPYNFYWLPGSKLNRWSGTIEELEIPKWELLELAEQGAFDVEKIRKLAPSKLDRQEKQTYLRFSERNEPSTPSQDTDVVKLLEFYGPLVLDGKIIEKRAHIIVANDNEVLHNSTNQFWHNTPPYVAFSPLQLPFRTDGVGLIEMVRQVDKALSKLANMSVDTLLFRLLPLFEVNLDVYENPEDFETGLTPGKIFRMNGAYSGQPGIRPIEFQDISTGAMQVSAQLDRAHQEGALVSEIQQALPRYRGVQSATEIEEKSANQESFFGAMASDIEKQALQPIIEMAVDLILQFVDTTNDPRVAGILGVGAEVFKALSREEIVEMIQGDYKIKVTGITSQLEKAQTLQNLTQFMNILGQNPEAWTPYIKQEELLRRVLEAFRPTLRDIENIVAEPALVQAKQLAATQKDISAQAVAQIPELVRLALEQQQQQQAAQQEQQVQAQQAQMQQAQMMQQQADTQESRDHEVAMAAMEAAAQAQQGAPPTK